MYAGDHVGQFCVNISFKNGGFKASALVEVSLGKCLNGPCNDYPLVGLPQTVWVEPQEYGYVIACTDFAGGLPNVGYGQHFDLKILNRPEHPTMHTSARVTGPCLAAYSYNLEQPSYTMPFIEVTESTTTIRSTTTTLRTTTTTIPATTTTTVKKLTIKKEDQEIYVNIDRTCADKTVKIAVLNERSEPMSEVNVKIYYNGIAVFSGKTDRTGLFKFTPTLIGNYQLIISKQGYANREEIIKISPCSEERILSQGNKWAYCEKPCNAYFE